MLDVNLSSIEHRTLFHYGVSLNNLNYNSRELQIVRRKYGEKIVQLRWDRSDLGNIHILDEDANTYLKVPCTWASYATGLSLWLHKAIRNEALSHEGPETQEKLDAAKARLREKVEKVLSNKKLNTRKTSARAMESFAASTYQMPVPEHANVPILQSAEKFTNAGIDDEQVEDIPDFEIHDRFEKNESRW